MTIITRQYVKLKNGKWQVYSLLPDGQRLDLEIIDKLPFDPPEYTELTPEQLAAIPPYKRRGRAKGKTAGLVQMIKDMKKAKVDTETIRSVVKARRAWEKAKEGGGK